jgi:hypothetical protein
MQQLGKAAGPELAKTRSVSAWRWPVACRMHGAPAPARGPSRGWHGCGRPRRHTAGRGRDGTRAQNASRSEGGCQAFGGTDVSGPGPPVYLSDDQNNALLSFWMRPQPTRERPKYRIRHGARWTDLKEVKADAHAGSIANRDLSYWQILPKTYHNGAVMRLGSPRLPCGDSWCAKCKSMDFI